MKLPLEYNYKIMIVINNNSYNSDNISKIVIVKIVVVLIMIVQYNNYKWRLVWNVFTVRFAVSDSVTAKVLFGSQRRQGRNLGFLKWLKNICKNK